jgi:hypothetical protein
MIMQLPLALSVSPLSPLSLPPFSLTHDASVCVCAPLQGETRRDMRLFKWVAVLSIALAVITILSIFGLSWAVASLSKDLTVGDSTGQSYGRAHRRTAPAHLCARACTPSGRPID